MRTVATLAVVLMAAANCGDNSESSGGKSRASGDGDPARSGVDVYYPDSTEGLERFVQDVFRALENDEQNEAQRLTSSLELADHETWFTATFGEEHGGSLAADYAPLVGQFAQMSALFSELLKSQQTQVAVERFVHADDPDLNGYQSLALGAMKSPTALYSVRLSKNGDERGFHLWSFVHQDGSFRWVGKMKPLRELEKTRFEWLASLPEDLDPLELRLREATALQKK